MNKQFRAWTRGVSFTLTLGKTQVGALVSIAESAKGREWVGWRHPLHSRFVQGARALSERGLVRHYDPGPAWDKKTIGEIYVITEEGKLVVKLLKATGVYQELAKEFHEADKARLRRIA